MFTTFSHLSLWLSQEKVANGVQKATSATGSSDS
jgi:hypothetical protein